MNNATEQRLRPAVAGGVADAAPGRRRPDWLVLAGLVLLAVAVRLVFFSGYQGHDDRTYLAYAHLHATGGSIVETGLRDPWVSRVAAWWPLSVAERLAGATEHALVLYQLLCSVANLLLAYAMGKLMLGPKAGLLAAGLMALLPLEVIYAIRAYADLPLGFFVVLSAYLLLLGLVREGKWALLGCGVALGIGYLHKETALLAAVPMAMWVLLRRRLSLRVLALPAAGFLCVFAAESAFWLRATQDPLFRFHAMSASHGQFVPAPSSEQGESSGMLPGPKPGERFRSDNSLLDAVLMYVTNEEFGLLYFLVWPLLLVYAWRHGGDVRLLTVWVGSLSLLLLFLPLHFPNYTVSRDPRFHCMVSIPAVLLLCAFLMRRSPHVRWGTVGLLSVTWIGCLYASHLTAEAEPPRELARHLRANPAQRTWVSNRFAADLLVLSRYPMDLPLGVHALEREGRRQAPGLSSAVRALRPELPFAASLDELRQGRLVLEAGTRLPLGLPLRLVDTLSVTATRGERVVMSVLRALPLPERLVRGVGARQRRSFRIYEAEPAAVTAPQLRSGAKSRARRNASPALLTVLPLSRCCA